MGFCTLEGGTIIDAEGSSEVDTTRHMWIKANSDGARAKHGGKGGGGVILPDHAGDFHAAACHVYPDESEPEAVEILTCKRAVQLAAEINIRRLHLETDNKAVALMLEREGQNLAVVSPRAEEIKAMFRFFDEVEGTWVRRTANSATHKLARVGVAEQLCKVWLMVPAAFILDVVSHEIPNFF
ncbi:Boron transporter-like protein 2 [Hordeum vulgare]|nr:Boron transporter-like protein 2 [Hordeum vulgare]